MNVIGNALSRSLLLMIGLMAVAVPVFAQSESSAAIALRDAPSFNTPTPERIQVEINQIRKLASNSSIAPPKSAFGIESLSAATRFALTPSSTPFDQWTAAEKDIFERRMNASAVAPEPRNMTGGDEPARNRPVGFVNRGPQPGQH